MFFTFPDLTWTIGKNTSIASNKISLSDVPPYFLFRQVAQKSEYEAPIYGVSTLPFYVKINFLIDLKRHVKANTVAMRLLHYEKDSYV